jgi:hypothetical protein
MSGPMNIVHCGRARPGSEDDCRVRKLYGTVVVIERDDSNAAHRFQSFDVNTAARRRSLCGRPTAADDFIVLD